MIGFVEGQIVFREGDQLVVNVHGVGYELLCSAQTLSSVEGQEAVRLWVYTQVREDAIQLYGFAGLAERQLFLTLIKVNGVGPKMAIHILSGAQVSAVRQMIEDGDVKALTRLPKVGKKTAEQIVLTLKGKLVLEDSLKSTEPFKARSEIISALVNLGFRLNDAEEVVAKMDPQVDVQTGIRHGLLALTSGA